MRTMILGPTEDMNPKSSWWCEGTDFYARCHAEQHRLQNSRFGRLVEMAKFGGNEARKDIRHKPEFWAE